MKNLTVFTPLPMTSTNEIHIMRNTQHTIETEEDVSDEEMEEEMDEKMTYPSQSYEGLDEEQIRQRVQGFFIRMGF